MPVDNYAAVEDTLRKATERLLSARTPDGHWEGELSSSALSTATSACALDLLSRSADGGTCVGRENLESLVCGGLDWLANHQNEDGGWGDTPESPSNISTTTLCWAALGADNRLAGPHAPVVKRAETWLIRKAGGLDPQRLTEAISAVYGEDRTFAVPILTMCALAGRFGTGRRAWRAIPALPFELAACPHKWFRRLGLPVVSYALPALIAVGQARHFHRPTFNPVTRLLRRLTGEKTLRVLQSIQPSTGGFLEAAPLTSFVIMSLVSIERADHPVVQRGAAFLVSTVRRDGSWPIDTNLATWVTTLSVNALATGGDFHLCLSEGDREGIRDWLVGQQYQTEHPYTHAAPGGWAWTDLSGGVPDADDTSGALLSLRYLATTDEVGGIVDDRVRRAVTNGVRWLLDLQNADGGIPTFCYGWGKLPFDRSSPDLTAHALRAWSTWQRHQPEDLQKRIARATLKAVQYLIRIQRENGTWTPLWFGNQWSANHENPLYGTTRVIRAGEVITVDGRLGSEWLQALQRGVQWLLSAQNSDGGWGGASSIPSSVEETALAVEALAGCVSAHGGKVADAVNRGCAWLVAHTNGGTRFEPEPIGLYFAKLWYYERLYPVIFTVSALQRVRHVQLKST